MSEEIEQSQLQKPEQDPTVALVAEIKALRQQASQTAKERDTYRDQFNKLSSELDAYTSSNGDVAKLREEFETKHQPLQHNAGLSALKAALVNHPTDYAELADAIVLKDGKKFGALDDGNIVLFDPDGTPAINAKGRYITPAEAAQTVITKLGGSSTKASTSGLKPYTFSSDGKLLVPRSEAAGGSEFRKQIMGSKAAKKAWDTGNIRVLPDSSFHVPVAQQLASKQAGNQLQITRSAMSNTRQWCRDHNVDPTKFSAMLNADRIRVVA